MTRVDGLDVAKDFEYETKPDILTSRREECTIDLEIDPNTPPVFTLKDISEKVCDDFEVVVENFGTMSLERGRSFFRGNKQEFFDSHFGYTHETTGCSGLAMVFALTDEGEPERKWPRGEDLPGTVLVAFGSATPGCPDDCWLEYDAIFQR